MNRRIIISVFLTLFIMIGSQQVFAAPPPPGVNEILEEMGEFEESFEGEKWEEAQEAITKIDRETKEILAQSGLTDEYLLSSLKAMQKYTLARNQNQLEAQYIRFQKQFFQLLDQFDYEVHPIITMLEKYVIDESSEAYENKDYDDVVSEMREAGNLIDLAKQLFVDKGVPGEEVDNFKATVIDIILVGKKEDYVRMGELLNKAKEQFAGLMTVYKK